MASNTAAELRNLFGSGQLDQLDIVRQALLSDPKALDNHSREVRDAKGQADACAASV